MISYEVKGGATVNTVKFVLKYSPALLKVSGFSLAGTPLASLGWNLQVTARADGALVTLSGAKALPARGALLAVSFASGTPTTAAAKLMLGETAINGRSAVITATGGTIQVGP